MSKQYDLPSTNQSPIDQFFDRKLVINLARRPDRCRRMEQRLQAVGISAERFEATDCQQPEIQAQFNDFLRTARWSVPLRKRIWTRGGFIRSSDHDARLAYLDHRRADRMVSTGGAWALLDSVRQAIHATLQSGAETLLLMEDDCVFHRDANGVFARVLEQLPTDWFLLQLGTMQWHWRPIKNYSEHLYCNPGLAIGTHAVGYSRQAMEEVLRLLARTPASYDEGIISTLTAWHPHRSFVVRPNVAVQDVEASDIGSAKHASSASLTRRWRRFRWRAEDYVF
jgi:GR25 family glycosyltransferase involved in LPS biosynthesis